MSTVTAVSASNLPIRIGDTLNIGVRPAAFETGSATSAGTKVLGAAQGAATVTKALTNATSIFTALTTLQYEIQRAGSSPDTATAASLTDKIATLTKQIDQLAAGAEVGDANLLAGQTTSVSVATATGLRVNIATQALDSRSLGLSNLSVSDDTSLRAATGTIAQALGQTQLAVYRLQTADGAVGTSTTSSAASTAYDRALSNQQAGASANTASAAVEKALNNQIAANASGYSSTGSSTGSTSTLESFFSLFV